MSQKKRWNLKSQSVPESIDGVLDILVANRNLDPTVMGETLSAMERYIQIQNMDAAANLMAEHIVKGDKIVLVGDYDCDGVTSAAQAALFLKQIGHRGWDTVIPNREEGYGVPMRAVTDNPDAKLFLVMDCGTLDVEPIKAARKLGADVVVIDHHEVPAEKAKLAPATHLVNPKQPGCPSLFKEFCASGLTMLFLTRLRRALSAHAAFGQIPMNGRYLALAAIGTIADMVPLTHGNRLIVKAGLEHINKPGFDYEPLYQLRKASGLTERTITAGIVGFRLAPQINAMGRMGDPATAYRLLTTTDRVECSRLAAELHAANAARQDTTDQVLSAIKNRAEAGEWTGKRTLVAADADWPHGVIGICASKSIESIHYGPTIIFEVNAEAGTAKGSARSVSGFDIYDALHQCDDLLERWGGHKMAAGLTVSMQNLQAFKDRFEQIAQACDPELFIPSVKVDCELPPGLVSKELWQAVSQLEPYGMGNSTPAFLLKDTRAEVKRVFGQGKQHLGLDIDGVPAIWWGGAEKYGLLAGEAIRTDMVVALDWDGYRDNVQLMTKEVGI